LNPDPISPFLTQYKTTEIEAVKDIRGVSFPTGVPFRHILITGPLGSGKTTLIEKIHGWSGEGYIDLAKPNWWRDRTLSVRPREIHFGIPFVGHTSVASGAWPDAAIDFKKIRLPSNKRRFYHTDWKSKYTFDFQLPPADLIYQGRSKRAKLESHPPDQHLSIENVNREIVAYTALAMYFHQNGLHVTVRNLYAGPPKSFQLDKTQS
jgi:GTPase SAR1 family protein